MKSFASLFFTVLFFTAHAQGNTVLRSNKFTLEKGLAIQGYDPVAYFKQGKAVKEKEEFCLPTRESRIIFLLQKTARHSKATLLLTSRSTVAGVLTQREQEAKK